MRGPIGGCFVWPGDRPALLVGGGSGVVPLMAMLRLARRDRARRPGAAGRVRAHARPTSTTPTSCPAPETARRVHPRRARRRPARRAAGSPPTTWRRWCAASEDVYVCGSPAFADAATDLLRGGRACRSSAIRVERFGPSG